MILGRDELVRRSLAELEGDVTRASPAGPPAANSDERTRLLPREALDRAALLEEEESEDADSAMLDAATMMLSREDMAKRREELLGASGKEQPRRENFRPGSTKPRGKK